MRVLVRPVGVALLVMVATVLLALTSTMTSVFTLAAATYIIRGTQYAFPLCVPFCAPPPNISALPTPQQNIDLGTTYIAGTLGNGPLPPNQQVTLLTYPASFYPFSVGYFDAPTYDQSVAQGVANLTALAPPGSVQPGTVIFGYSQGAEVATIYKRNFNAYWASNPSAAPNNINFVLIGNPNRPNGGMLERANGFYIPILDVSFDGATPTQTAGATGITTFDIARQYDGYADFPTNPLNLLADVNALAGMQFVHLNYQGTNMSQAVFQATYGDTAYYMIPTYPLPLLMPVQVIPVVGPVLADTLDPALRVLVEAGYNRTTNPGVPTPGNFLYFPNPATLATNFLVAIPTGLDNGISDITGTRPFGTLRPTAANGYVVGGPSLTLPPQPGQLPAPVLPPSPPPPGSLWTSLFSTTNQPPQPPVQHVAAVNAGPATQPTITPAVQPIFTPPELESASTTIPTIPSLLNPVTGLSPLLNPGAGLSSLLDPTMFQAEFAQFSSLVSILNGVLPVNIASLFTTSPGLTGLPSLLNPMAVLTQIVKAAAQNLPNMTQNVAASIPSPTQPPAQTLPDQTPSAPPVEAPHSLRTTSNASQQTADQNETGNAQNGSDTIFSRIRSGTDTPSVDTASSTSWTGTPAANTSNSEGNPAPNPPSTPSSRPRLNVCRPSPCGASPQAGTTTSSPANGGNGIGAPITSAINGVTSAIGGAVTNTVNAISGALGQHPAGSGSSHSSSGG